MQNKNTTQSMYEYDMSVKEIALWNIIAAAITTALTLTLFTIHTPKPGQELTKSDVKHMFEREREVLHMHANYGARARYVSVPAGE